MKKRSGPKTKASKGQRRHAQMTITVPAELADMVISIATCQHLTKSAVIVKALKMYLTPNQK